MDSDTLIAVIVLIAFLAFLFIWGGKSRGELGEKNMAFYLSFLPKKKYKVINDVLLKLGDYSTQIDHVVVSVYGIFVIETKYYQGWVYGGENSECWTQSIYGHKSQFRNPLWQNQGHCRAIARVIGTSIDVPIHNIVAFSRQADLKVDRTLPVMYWRQVVPFIKRFKQPLITESLVDNLYNAIRTANVTDKAARKQHVYNVRYIQKRRDIAVFNGKCPLCGGDLVLRHGAYGQFYGCSNYPNCKYILK